MAIRVNVTVKGEMEDYVKKEMERTGDAAGTVCKNLCDFGMAYKQGLASMAVLAATLEQENAKNATRKEV